VLFSFIFCCVNGITFIYKLVFHQNIFSEKICLKCLHLIQLTFSVLHVEDVFSSSSSEEEEDESDKSSEEEESEEEESEDEQVRSIFVFT